MHLNLSLSPFKLHGENVLSIHAHTYAPLEGFYFFFYSSQRKSGLISLCISCISVAQKPPVAHEISLVSHALDDVGSVVLDMEAGYCPCTGKPARHVKFKGLSGSSPRSPWPQLFRWLLLCGLISAPCSIIAAVNISGIKMRRK